ncbi:phasin family protein [Sphingomonas oligophenolica]|uniref:Phasin family protein n=1 Tax=Sphingomonas oligophenolica TaxID=301154 RepID=A0A502CS26_9SPHN|nr:phasin family protein [Sphingomonas oligophenolica]TPG15532.1 phasin family protein [Sphingomonas oligophenolica]
MADTDTTAKPATPVATPESRAAVAPAAKPEAAKPDADKPAVKPDAKPAPAAAAPKADPAPAKPAATATKTRSVAKKQAAKPKTAKLTPAKRKPAARKAATKTRNPIAATAAPAKKDKMMDAMKTTTDKAKDMIAQANERTKTAVDKSQKMFGEINDFSKGNIEAIVESSKIAAKGIEAMSQDAVAYAKTSFEDATAAAKKLASVKSPTDFMKLQSDFVRSSFDMMVAHTSKSTEAMLKLAGEVAQPISNRVSLAAEKIKIAA